MGYLRINYYCLIVIMSMTKDNHNSTINNIDSIFKEQPRQDKEVENRVVIF